MTKLTLHRNTLKVRPLLLSAALSAGIAWSTLSASAFAAEITVYKTPWCGCCSKWVDHLQAYGHDVTIKNMENLDVIKKMAGVPESLQSCHTAAVDGYVIEGHVPAKDIDRLLAEHPKARGLSVPGMPVGSPGMEGGTADRYDVIMFGTDGSTSVYAQH